MHKRTPIKTLQNRSWCTNGSRTAHEAGKLWGQCGGIFTGHVISHLPVSLTQPQNGQHVSFNGLQRSSEPLTRLRRSVIPYCRWILNSCSHVEVSYGGTYPQIILVWGSTILRNPDIYPYVAMIRQWAYGVPNFAKQDMAWCWAILSLWRKLSDNRPRFMWPLWQVVSGF